MSILAERIVNALNDHSFNLMKSGDLFNIKASKDKIMSERVAIVDKLLALPASPTGDGDENTDPGNQAAAVLGLLLGFQLTSVGASEEVATREMTLLWKLLNERMVKFRDAVHTQARREGLQ